jgi:oxygen-dependent protoporphyrinogen oxidase
MRIAIIGGGIAGLTAAWQLHQFALAGVPVEAILYESSARLGGLIETVREGGFIIEAGPDAWVSAKPWATELANELGLAGELIPSNDATRKTHLYFAGSNGHARLTPMPDGLNLFVPTDLDAFEASHQESSLFTGSALAAYRAEPARAAELLAQIPTHDESVADFTLRHFGPEVLERIAAPLLSGILGGDVYTLSARATLPALISAERSHGSLISALKRAKAQPSTGTRQPATIFTTLRSGLATLTDTIAASLPPHWLRLNTTVTTIQPSSDLRTKNSELPPWFVTTTDRNKQVFTEPFDAVFLATPLPVTRHLLTPLLPEAAEVLPTESSSAVLVAFAFPEASRVPLPPGFGFLVPPPQPSRSQVTIDSLQPATSSLLLACTFADQKFPHRVPPNGRLIRAYFGGAPATRLAACNNDEIAAIARAELARILNASAPLTGPTPTPLPHPVITVVRRWPNSLPQYAVGHLDRAAQLEARIATLPGLTLLGNTLHGVGIPDLVRAARAAARRVATGEV